MKIKSFLFSAFLFAASPTQASTIYQAFEEPFAKLEQKLPRLKELGYTYVQISPPQKSIPRSEWWARYQPLDHSTIEGPLGNEDELKSLVAKTHELGLKLLVDAVLNHMADPFSTTGLLEYPEFNREDFHFPDNRPCIDNYYDRFQVTHFWLCSDARDRGLPDLNTGSPKVRAVLLKYLEKLISIGVDGFRFDAMKHIEPEFWAYLMPKIQDRGLYYYGEVIGQTLDESYAYTSYSEITDFHLLAQMLRTFAWGGDLRSLYNPVAQGHALKGNQILFARNHDTVMHPTFYNFSDYTDSMLANAYLLAKGDGTVSIYREDSEHPLVKAGLEFRNKTTGFSTEFIPVDKLCGGRDGCDPRTLMVLARGEEHLMILNTSTKYLEIPAPHLQDLLGGCYQNIQSREIFFNHAEDSKRGIMESHDLKDQPSLKVSGRSALFFERIQSQNCTSNGAFFEGQS